MAIPPQQHRSGPALPALCLPRRRPRPHRARVPRLRHPGSQLCRALARLLRRVAPDEYDSSAYKKIKRIRASQQRSREGEQRSGLQRRAIETEEPERASAKASASCGLSGKKLR